MGKMIAAFFGGVVFTAVLAWNMMGGHMFNERISPLGVEDVALIQRDIQANRNGWTGAGLPAPTRTFQSAFSNTLAATRVGAARAPASKAVGAGSSASRSNITDARAGNRPGNGTSFLIHRISIYHLANDMPMPASIVVRGQPNEC